MFKHHKKVIIYALTSAAAVLFIACSQENLVSEVEAVDARDQPTKVSVLYTEKDPKATGHDMMAPGSATPATGVVGPVASAIPTNGIVAPVVDPVAMEPAPLAPILPPDPWVGPWYGPGYPFYVADRIVEDRHRHSFNDDEDDDDDSPSPPPVF